MSDGHLTRLVDALGKGAKLENYIVPGLQSTLLASSLNGGKVRVFDMTREQEYDITPHDHRYDFQCCVLAGSVTNRRYTVIERGNKEYATHAIMQYDYAKHELDEAQAEWAEARFEDETFGVGAWYSMKATEFHAIRFSRGAKVLFIEGAEVKAWSSCLLPYVNGRICNTFIWRDWMMAAEAAR